MMMEFACGYRAKNEIKMKRLKGETIGSNSDATLLIIKLPNSLVLRVMSRSLFLAMVMLALASICSSLRGPPTSLFDSQAMGSEADSVTLDLLPLLSRDLADEGLLKKGDKALVVSSGTANFMDYSEFLNVIDFAIESDLDRQGSIPDETFDFVFSLNSGAIRFIDRVLKVGGIVVMQLSNDPSNDFQLQSNYKIEYLRQFNSTVIAMRKIALADDSDKSPTKLHRHGGVTLEAKKAVLEGLEDALLEPPPRQPLAKPSDYLQKTKFLPDLLADSLGSYRRRVLITDDNGGALDWFYQSYPMRNQYFEVYNFEIYDLEVVNEVGLRRGMWKMTGISDWLMENVREEDFVVMKAEAQVVEEMVREKTIGLVDELFLECNNQEQNEGKKAYWECLALYGRLREEGVAVHQWWG